MGRYGSVKDQYGVGMNEYFIKFSKILWNFLKFCFKNKTYMKCPPQFTHVIFHMVKDTDNIWAYQKCVYVVRRLIVYLKIISKMRVTFKTRCKYGLILQF